MSKAISSEKVIIDGQIIPATLIFSLNSGKILTIFENQILDKNDPILIKYNVISYRNLSPYVIMPGLVDSHVHLNEPGRTEWEGFATGTQSAASGGVTTVIDMPLNAIPPTTTIENFNLKLQAAKGQTWVDTGFWGGLVPTNLDDLVPLIQSGVRGFKGFMMDSGVDEFPMIDPKYIDQALQKVKGFKTMLMFHAEMDDQEETGIACCGGIHSSKKQHEHYEGITDSQAEKLSRSPILQAVEPKIGKIAKLAKSPELKGVAGFSLDAELDDDSSIEEITPLDQAIADNSELESVDPRAYSSFLASRPDSFEFTAIKNIIECSLKQSTTPIHIVHLASKDAVPLVSNAKFNLNLPISAETCFHYLTINSEDIPDGATQFKCCPPIRTQENRIQLWKALQDDVITSVVSDHSPCVPELKGLEKGDFFQAWGGITSVGLGLPLIFTEGSTRFNVSLLDITKWCCENTAKQVGLSHKKGKLQTGYDADIVIFDDSVVYEIENERTFFKNKLTAFNGKKIKGRVVETILRGNSIYAFGKGVSDVPMGKLILEQRTA